MVLRGHAGVKLLDSYNEERLENAKDLLKTTDSFFNLAASPEPLMSFLRLHIFPYVAGAAFKLGVVKKFIFPRISQIAINYRHSSMSDHVGDSGLDVKSGDRMPYFTVDGASVYDKLREPKFHLVTFSDGQESADELNGEIKDLADHHQIPIYPRVAELFGTEKSFNVLLRPDNYIATISDDTSLAPIENYLKRCL
jgi:hypothetical protein